VRARVTRENVQVHASGASALPVKRAGPTKRDGEQCLENTGSNMIRTPRAAPGGVGSSTK
jgi:hypothetical protein